MSQAFIRESEDQWLEDVGPGIKALVHFLTRENGGIAVYEKDVSIDNDGREVYTMSNGLRYAKNKKSKWEVVVS